MPAGGGPWVGGAMWGCLHPHESTTTPTPAIEWNRLPNEDGGAKGVTSKWSVQSPP